MLSLLTALAVPSRLRLGGEWAGWCCAFCPTTGEGYAAEVHGDYARTRRLGITVTLLLVEAFGGLSGDLVQP